MELEGGSFLMISTLALSTSIPLGEILWLKTIPSDVLNCKWTILSSSIKDYISHRDVNNKQLLEL